MHRGADLFDPAAVEDDDPIGEGHRFDLVMGDVDHRRAETDVQLRDFQAHLHAQRRVEIGERLVEQEDFRVADDRAPDGDALPLAARQLPRASCQQVFDLQRRRHFPDAPIDLLATKAHETEAEADVLGGRHVGEERVGLEDHGDFTLRGRDARDVAVIDADQTGGNILEARDHAQHGRLATA